ncbi:MAG: hypothetical protein MUC57_11450, partial [Desulfobacterales bacterium]|nr:hypothetical protein [Desulfobacterales bacterium]
MKKYLSSFLLFCFLIIGVPVFSIAALIDLGNGVLQDDRNTENSYDDQYWIQDLNLFKNMTYNEQIAAIANLTITGFTSATNWRMATYSDLVNLESLYPMWSNTSTIADAFTPTETFGGHPYWSARYDREFYSSNPSDPNAPYHYEANIWLNSDLIYSWGLNVGISDSIISVGAFVTANASPAPVPEPTSMLI